MDTSIVRLIDKTMLFLSVSSIYPFAHWCFRYKAAKKRWKSSLKKVHRCFHRYFHHFFHRFHIFTVLVKNFHRFGEKFSPFRWKLLIVFFNRFFKGFRKRLFNIYILLPAYMYIQSHFVELYIYQKVDHDNQIYTYVHFNNITQLQLIFIYYYFYCLLNFSKYVALSLN